MSLIGPTGNFFSNFQFFSPQKMSVLLLPKKKKKKEKKKEIGATKVAIISATRWTGNKLFFKGGLIYYRPWIHSPTGYIYRHPGIVLLYFNPQIRAFLYHITSDIMLSVFICFWMFYSYYCVRRCADDVKCLNVNKHWRP